MSTQDTEKTTKPKAATKSRKPSTKKKAVAPPSHTDIALLAEKYWEERGRPNGSPELDWLRAEQELLAQAS